MSEKITAQVKEKVQEKAVNGALKCSVAFQIAQELDVSPKQVGEIVNEIDVKLTDCQLGCF